jgi:cytoskeleton protein RodZ
MMAASFRETSYLWCQEGSLPGFGEQLERERVKRGIKLEQISERTKISTRMLRALETEEFEKLPGGVFNRGFVRSYARYLGINEEQAVADYVAAAGEEELPLPMQQADEAEEVARWLPLAAVVAVTVLAVFVMWRYSGTLTNVWQRAMAKRPPAVQALTPANSVTTKSEPPKSQAATSDAVLQSSEKHASATLQADRVRPVKMPAVSATPSTMPATTATQAGKPSQITITVRARQQAWLSVTADGRAVMQGLLEASNERQFHAERRLVFVTGNAGGVDLSFNGAPYGPLGADKQRRQITFTSDGAQQ